MRKEKQYERVCFTETTMRQAISLFLEKIDPTRKKVPFCRFSVETEVETWTYDSQEDFFKDYRNFPIYASVHIALENSQFNLTYSGKNSKISVETKEYSTIQSVFDIFEKQSQASRISPDELSSTIAKTKRFKNTFFSAEVIKEASALFLQLLDSEGKHEKRFFLSIDMGEEEWEYNSPEDFFNEYRKSPYSSNYRIMLRKSWLSVRFQKPDTSARVESIDRTLIHKLFNVFEKHKNASKMPDVSSFRKVTPKIFIGHGRSPLWKELKDHLREQHGYPIEAYEIGPKAGYSIKNILESMLKESSFALLVMTGENRTERTQLRARDNVIHELGLFQGKIGFNRTIVLLEKGTKEFSNITGIQQIRFKKGNIKEVFGEVLATLNREFLKNMKKS